VSPNNRGTVTPTGGQVDSFSNSRALVSDATNCITPQTDTFVQTP
jgi:hypothetical protein